MIHRTELLLAAALAMAAPAAAAGEQAVDYTRDVKPILKARCYACHGALEQESGLRLDTGRSIRQGGDSGPAVAPGKPDESLLIARVAANDALERMPPEGEPLTTAQIEIIKSWIAQGAAAPEDELPESDPQRHWAFQAPQRPAIPMTDGSDRAHNPIDAFLAREHARRGLTPQPAAPKHTLLRRVYLDLIGLPPMREELLAFLADDSPDAYARVVDRLLNSPQYGQRWARHWMDVWRYSDWYGRRNQNDVRNSAGQIWRWRDWIVRSLNADHGYDRMVREMLAADEIYPEDREAAVATGFLVRNYFSLNPNDWMRGNVEHTGKAFLGLTFNCAHCHDHKYDPIAHEDYFRLRAFFEPIYIRQDRVPGEADPGPFEDYVYGGSRKVQRLGAVRIFDKSPDAPTWFYTGGDERNRVVERGSIPPGAPAFLADWMPKIEPVELPPRAWYPGLNPAIQETVLADVRRGIAQAERELEKAQADNAAPSQAARDQLAHAEAAYEAGLEKAKKSGRLTALEGKQSLLFGATGGRRAVHNRLPGLKMFGDGFAIEFQLLIVSDAHFNFQLAKDVEKGLTAGLVAFDKGRIVSYQPGTFTEFEVGRYGFAAGQNRFHVKMILSATANHCLLTVRSLSDDVLLAESTPVALNGWNPIGDPTKAISFDARTGSVAAVDELIVTLPAQADMADGSAPITLARFDFEAPAFSEGCDVAGLGGWEASPFSVAPATSLLSATLGDAELTRRMQELQVARRAVRAPTLRIQAAESRVLATRAELAGVEARIAADRAKYGETPGEDASALARAASRLEREAALRKAKADVLSHEYALALAEGKPSSDANREKEIEAAQNQLAAARAALDEARTAAQDETSETYSPLSRIYPKTSTGRRRALAEWITNPRNPLTARVAVNHIWMRHFHAPLVASVYDFGRNGALPTHPELLDWLAVEFMESGWSMKRLHRLIVTSDAYRRTSAVGDASQNAAVDPENTLLWRMNVGRMEAEVVRDSLLYCAGRLDQSVGGQELENSEALTTYRRSLYYSVHPEQGGGSALGELFDAPDPLECYRRTRSIVPQQALALTNSDLVHQMSAAIARDWEAKSEFALAGDEPFVVAMFERILSRAPTDAERRLCLDALAEHRNLLHDADSEQAARRARESLVRVLLNHNDFITIR